jgi:hypothetical protein
MRRDALLRTWQSCPSYCVKLDALIMSEPSNEVSDADARPTDTEVAETGTRPDLVWDNEVPGLCVRVHGNGEKSFIFVYRRDNRQHLVRIGTTPGGRLREPAGGPRSYARPLTRATIQNSTMANAKRLSLWKASSN